MIKKTVTGFIIAVFMATVPPSALSTTSIHGVSFDSTIVQDSKELKITGAGLLKYMRIFKVYTAAFYLESGASVDDALGDTAKRFEVSYLRAFKGKDFGDATYKALRMSISEDEIERLRTRIEYHNSLYTAVEPGDRYAVTYIPGKGTELARNGEVVGVIQGADFAAALFSIWVGDNPIDWKFRQDLLGAR